MSRKKQKQTSETFILGALLALSGGFQDAYTYNAVSYTHLTLPTN